MGRYDIRRGDGSAGVADRWAADLDDPYISKRWGPRHEQAIRRCIRDFQWGWAFRVAPYLWPEIDDATLRRWARSDPRVKPRGNPSYDEAWNLRAGAESLLNAYAATYAREYGLT